MLPKEERSAMLLRIFNDETPLVNITDKQKQTETGETPTTSASETAIERPENEEEFRAPPEAEDKSLIQENIYLGEEEQEGTDERETWTKANGEEDRFNTTV